MDPSTAAIIQSFVRRVQLLEDKIRGMNADKALVYAEAKSNGLDVKVLKAVVSALRKDSRDREEEAEMFALYLEAATSALPTATAQEAA